VLSRECVALLLIMSGAYTLSRIFRPSKNQPSAAIITSQLGESLMFVFKTHLIGRLV